MARCCFTVYGGERYQWTGHSGFSIIQSTEEKGPRVGDVRSIFGMLWVAACVTETGGSWFRPKVTVTWGPFDRTLKARDLKARFFGLSAIVGAQDKPEPPVFDTVKRG